MNEIPLSVFEMLLALDLIVSAYTLYKLSFFEKSTLDKILSCVIASPLSFILSSYIINGEVVQTFADVNGFHFIQFESLPLYYFLTGLAILMTVLALIMIIKFISDHFEALEKESALGDWQQNAFTRR